MKMALMMIFILSLGSIMFAAQSCPEVITSSCAILNESITHYTLGANLTNGVDIYVSDVIINCAGYAFTGSGVGRAINVYNNVDNVTIRNCEIFGFTEGIRAVGTGEDSIDNLVIEYCDIHNNADPASGIHLEYTNNAQIYNTDVYSHGTNIYISDSVSPTIDTCDIYDSIQGIYIQLSEWPSVRSSSIYENEFGVSIYESDGFLIDTNDIYDNGFAVFAYDNFEPDIVGNDIYSNEQAIKADYYDYGSIYNNDIYDNSYGIELSGSINNEISNNNIYRQNSMGESYGIYITHISDDVNVYSENNTISNNVIEKNSEGIVISDAIGTVITDNTINNNVASGPVSGIDIYANYLFSYPVEISENRICGNKPYGIYVSFAVTDPQYYPIIEDNTFCVDLLTQNDIVLKPDTEYGNFGFDFSNMLFYDNFIIPGGMGPMADPTGWGAEDAGLLGNCTIYINGDPVQTALYWTQINYSEGNGYTFVDVPIEYAYQTWEVRCGDNWGNEGRSPIYSLLTSESEGDSSFIVTTPDVPYEVTFTDLGIELEINTFCYDSGSVTVNKFISNPSGTNFGVKEFGEYFSITEDFYCFDSAIIRLYYNESNLPAGVTEDKLKIYYYDTETGDWVPYNPPNGGVNTTENYVWANTTHFTLFGTGGVVASGSSGSSDKDALSYKYEVTCPDNSLAVEVKSEETLIDDALVVVYRNGAFFDSKRTGTDGLAVFTLVADGTYTISVRKTDYTLPAESVFTHTMCTIIIPPECISDSDCELTKYCLDGNCVDVTGVCGYVLNHKWVAHECCSNSECGTGYECTNNKCILIPVEEEIPEVEEETDSEPEEKETVTSSKTGQSDVPDNTLGSQEEEKEVKEEPKGDSTLITILAVVLGGVIIGAIVKIFLLNKN